MDNSGLSASGWIERSSGNLLADRRFAYAESLEAEGDHAAAADLLVQALELAPAWAAGWASLGAVITRQYEDSGLATFRDAAVAAFEKALAVDPDDAFGVALYLARLGGSSPETMPAAYVRGLFDQYAESFDRHLSEALAYRAPAVLRAAVEAVCLGASHPCRFHAVLDLGCGTGLGGAAFRDVAGRLSGVDLSGAIVDVARRKSIYDRLVVGDLGAFLAGEPAASADLVIAADVLVYVGHLQPLGAAVARVLVPGGLFAFTVQACGGDIYSLGPDLRFAHSPTYIRDMARRAGLTISHLEPQSTRKERGVDVPGLAVVLRAA